ncbi:MAG: SMC family ATPase [Clostridium butyricum]|nr:SMC family ATPase [Clostridium butyricum]
MKPIKLTIEGLNSFIEKQTIDFEELTSQGFFGIFGPTGSGKSSVLDGITLALYGNIARKSSNYININCDRLNVNFEFQICGAETKRYIVDREFRRKKEGNILAGKCKLIDCDTGDILADSVKTLNKTIETIIGLNLEDFTRTVVLPQGKFSEFLKLEGKERREMLERLFNLQKYGDNLSSKLAREIVKQRNESNVLNGQLIGYEDITEENLTAKKVVMKKINDEILLLKSQVEKLNEEFKDSERLWNLQIELNEYSQKKFQLEDKKDIYNEFKSKIKLGEASNRVLPYIKSYESTIEVFRENKERLDLLNKKIEEVKKQKDEIDKFYNSAKEKKDNVLPKLLLEEQKVSDAITEEIALQKILEKIKLLVNEKQILDNKINENNVKVIDIKREIEKYSSEIEKNQNEYDNLKVDEELKQKIQQGILEEQKINAIKEILIKDKEKKITIEKDNIIILEEGKKLRNTLDSKKKLFEEYVEKIKVLDSNCPGDQNVLLKFRDCINEAKEKTNSLKKLNEEVESYEKEIKDLILDKDSNKQKMLDEEKKLEEMKAELSEAIKENLAQKLRTNLIEGEMCPVCGSTHHMKENIKTINLKDVTVIENMIKKKEKEIKLISEKVIQYESKALLLHEKNEKDKEEINKIEAALKESPLEELQKRFEKLEQNLELYKKEKESTEKLLNDIKNKITEEQGKINSKREVYANNLKQITLMTKEIDEKERELNLYENSLCKLKSETNVDDFNKKNEEINEIEKKRNALEKILKENRNELDKLKVLKEKFNTELSLNKETVAKISTNLNSYEESKNEKIQSIKNKVGEEKELNNLLIKIRKTINEIEDLYKNTENRKNEIEKEYKDVNENLISVRSKDKDLIIRKISEETNLNNAIKEEHFENLEEAKSNIVEDEVLKSYREKVDLYNENLSKVDGAIESLLKKIDGKEISREKYENIRMEKHQEEEKYSKLNEEKIKCEEELRNLEIKMNEQKELLMKRKDLDHKIALLSDLEKLFKGKKFVEFVAAYQLKYVSIEASKRLKEITHGTFGIEVNENGKFIIRDYKNGGAGRDASTLSGGETFLASLSLALALSAQIQLKGTAPLELFFLDEGFGTLDDELLEVVMNSLERIHNDKLKVGIISHVESIKNRVPIKLVITPAECGVAGSKVRIERS